MSRIRMGMRMGMRMRNRTRGEGGFTLVEMLMAIVVMGIIMGPLTAGVIVGLRTTDETANRLNGSNDAQILSVWLPPDIQSTGNQVGDVVYSPTVNTECSNVSNRLRLKWRETQGSTTTSYVVAYAVVAGTGGGWTLVRYQCINGAAATTHLVSRNLASSTATTVTASGTKVTMTVTEKATPTDPTSYTFTVSGNRRTL